MELRDLDVWRRQRPYITAELLKDAPDHLTRLGLATSFALVVGVAEGARVSALRSDLRFPLRYSIYNVIPSFVGGKVPHANVASTMANPPPLRACPKALAHATNLRALRTAVAGCTVLSIMFQVTLAGGRGAQAYERAVAEGREVPILDGRASRDGTRSPGGVIRLCGAEGLESALQAGQLGRADPVLPVVISTGATGLNGSDSNPSSLPAAALAAVAKFPLRPSYYRVDTRRLFCHEAWRPVLEKIADAERGAGRRVVHTLEADTLSSNMPHKLLSPPMKDAMDGGEMSGSAGTGRLGLHEGVWGLGMLRSALAEGNLEGGLAGIILAKDRTGGVEGPLTVSIDARAALLFWIISWGEQCSVQAKTEREAELLPSQDQGVTADMDAKGTLDFTDPGSGAEAEGSAGPTTETSDDASDVHSSDDDTAEGAEEVAAGSSGRRRAVRAAVGVLSVIERMGRGVRGLIAPDGRLRFTINRCLCAAHKWVETRRAVRGDAKESSVLLYDTDDDESFRWLADQMLRQGWILRRAGNDPTHGTPRREASEMSACVPVVVHHRSDEQTLTAAAGYLARGVPGRPVCVVVHGWDCGAAAKRLLPANQFLFGGRVGQEGLADVICTAEVGEDLFQFVRSQLQFGMTPAQVQEGLDEMFGSLYDTESG